jgi:hypothetical protein
MEWMHEKDEKVEDDGEMLLSRSDDDNTYNFHGEDYRPAPNIKERPCLTEIANKG